MAERSQSWHRVETVEEWATALLSGFPVMKGRKRHAIFDFIWDYDEHNRWYAGYCNSWGSWGDKINDTVGKGLGWDSEGLVDRCVGYACTGVTIRDDITADVPAPQ